jgi:hypothetical protein
VLEKLFAGDFDGYFAEAGKGDPLWLFIHVPKTAGSSMQAEMAAIHKPAGHILSRHTELLRKTFPDIRCFTMLRNPIARIISDYRYQRSDMNVARTEFVAKTPDFATYVARPFVHNKTALALVPRPMVLAGDTEGAIDHVMKTYSFVGLQEMYPVSIRALTTLMGDPRSAEAKVRVNPQSDDNRVVLNPEQDAELRKLNAVDIAIVQAFTEKWKIIRDDLRAYLGKARKAA